jgi:predicted transcriptional regulator
VSRKLISFRLPVGLVDRVDVRAAELGQTRTMFLIRALEQALGSTSVAEAPAVVREEAGSIPPDPAPARAALFRSLTQKR